MYNLITQIDKHGRIVIPAAWRNFLNMRIGDRVFLQKFENEIRLTSVDQTVDEMHALFTKNRDPKGHAVEEFLADRQKERSVELQRLQRS